MFGGHDDPSAVALADAVSRHVRVVLERQVDDLARVANEQAERLRVFEGVFRATWREALGRRWPNLAGDVGALCEQARALGAAEALAEGGAPGSAVPERRAAEGRERFG